MSQGEMMTRIRQKAGNPQASNCQGHVLDDAYVTLMGGRSALEKLSIPGIREYSCMILS